jgi:isopentenyl diphosphate isomerase/L-lactate dehydrogenase-like FMN-dependent dehydrogenase
VYVSLVAGTQQGWTLRDNLRAFDEIGLLPRVGTGAPNPPSLATTALGMDLAKPVLLAPEGPHAVHPAGEAGAARAAAAAGTAIIHSSFASQPFSDVVRANPQAACQIYWVGSRDVMLEYVTRAASQGARALVLTMDVVAGPAPRDWGTPRLPARLSTRELVRGAPLALARPRWLAGFLTSGALPTLLLPNLRTSTRPAPSLVDGRAMMAQAGLPTWDDVAWLRSCWHGPFMVKGVMHPDDARRAVAAGATAVSVSNHGGNNLDGTPSALRALSAVVDAVGSEVEVLYDGGIRRGGAVAKALALGARAVLVGRAWVFALAARGDRGVLEILTTLRDGLGTAVVALGHGDVRQLGRPDLHVPREFALSFGEDGTHTPS